ncbi:hypothetical protein [Clostridium rectalis]|uniref:hypothetical protein n=1 Tax=Clostridium rectalis TaxID=2040295 RepID=UPI000F62F4A4|nr:hypothetical protein [Clostridium rectalis]
MRNYEEELSFKEVIANIQEGETYNLIGTAYKLREISMQDGIIRFKHSQPPLCVGGEERYVKKQKEVSINNVVEDEEVEEIADYLIEFASDAFKHKDREGLIKALKHYRKCI